MSVDSGASTGPNESQLVAMSLQAGAFTGAISCGLLFNWAGYSGSAPFLLAVLGFLLGGSLGFVLGKGSVPVAVKLLRPGRPQTLFVSSAIGMAVSVVMLATFAALGQLTVDVLWGALGVGLVMAFGFGFPGVGP